MTDERDRHVHDELDVTDAHVHLFPDRVFDALWRWFDNFAWEVRHRMYSEKIIEFLTSRGIRHMVALHYSHVPDMARSLNTYMAEVGRAHPQVVPLATVLPGEPDAKEILREALGALGLRGVKIHCHVQQIGPADPRMEPVYQACEEARVPLVIHAGREPALSGYGKDPRSLCGADQVEGVLRRHPRLAMVVPHMGADEFEAYGRLLGQYENLCLDTTMTFYEGLGDAAPFDLLEKFPDRIMYGSDFPNIPHDWDHELTRLLKRVTDPARRRSLFSSTARRMFSI